MEDHPPAAPFRFHDPRMRGFHARASVESVQSQIDHRLRPLDTEPVPLFEAAGRVLSHSVSAALAVPGFDRSAMDGYAVRGEQTAQASPDHPSVLKIVGRSRPGLGFESEVQPGQAVEIATGAPMPPGANAVARVEATRLQGDSVLVLEPVAPGRHVGRLGEDVRPGDPLLPAGRVLRPQDLGVLSAQQLQTVNVIRRPRVAILITGDELTPAGSPAHGFRIPDMNAPMLAALAARDGAIPRVEGPLRDDRTLLKTALLQAQASSDLILISGGSSTGPEDHAPSLVEELGQLSAHGVALRPASPSGLGFVNETPVLLLPGNPVSCLCAYDFFAARAIRRLGGRQVEWPYRSEKLPIASPIRSAAGRVDYVRVLRTAGRAEPLATRGASILSSTSRADGFLIVEADIELLAPEDEVLVWLYDT